MAQGVNARVVRGGRGRPGGSGVALLRACPTAARFLPSSAGRPSSRAWCSASAHPDECRTTILPSSSASAPCWPRSRVRPVGPAWRGICSLPSNPRSSVRKPDRPAGRGRHVAGPPGHRPPRADRRRCRHRPGEVSSQRCQDRRNIGAPAVGGFSAGDVMRRRSIQEPWRTAEVRRARATAGLLDARNGQRRSLGVAVAMAKLRRRAVPVRSCARLPKQPSARRRWGDGGVGRAARHRRADPEGRTMAERTVSAAPARPPSRRRPSLTTARQLGGIYRTEDPWATARPTSS